jgi:hypothetical protein
VVEPLGQPPRKTRRIGVGAAALLALAFCVLGPACAIAPWFGVNHASSAILPRGYKVVDAFPYGRFVVTGTNGYRILVTGTPRAARLLVWRGHRAAQYIAMTGHADEFGIHAQFGKLGYVSARFQPSGRTTGRPLAGDLRHCRSIGEPLDQLGEFVGRIEFRGEHGFTKMQLGHARGRAAPSRSLACLTKGSDGDRKPAVDPNAPRISAVSFLGSFYAGAGAFSSGLKDRPLPLGLARLRPGGVPFSAEVFEIRGPLWINRVAAAKGPPASFTRDVSGRTGTIRPPWPFRGSASLSNCPFPNWRGSLTVSFPGKEVQLTQPAFGTAVLLPAKRCLEGR